MATVFNLSEGRESARELSDVIAERDSNNFNHLAQMTVEEQRRSLLSPTALHQENMKAREEKAKDDAEAAWIELERKQNMIKNAAAEEIFSRKISEQIQANVDPSTIIKAAIPANSQWQIDDKNDFVMQLKDGVTFSGKDLVRSVYATKQVVTDMLGEGHAAIFDRAFIAPLDPNYRLQSSAKDAVAPFIGEMQKNGSFSPKYTEENVGIVTGSIDMGIVEKALRGSLEQLQGGANPSDTAIAAMSMVADSKGFSDYPDAAKKYVLETVAEKIDLLSNNLTSKVGADVSALFNSIDQETISAISKIGADLDTQELMPVSSEERAELIKEISSTRDTVRNNQSFLIANEGVLSIPWADRKIKDKYSSTSLETDKLKEKLSELYKKTTRDIPHEKADPVGAALFGIGSSAFDWRMNPDKVEKDIGVLSQNLAAMNLSDQRKFIAERLVNNWYAENGKDQSKAPINAAIRIKMLDAIKSGQKLAPEIEESIGIVMQNFKITQAQKNIKDQEKAKEKQQKFDLEIKQMKESLLDPFRPTIKTSGEKGSATRLMNSEYDWDDARDDIAARYLEPAERERAVKEYDSAHKSWADKKAKELGVTYEIFSSLGGDVATIKSFYGQNGITSDWNKAMYGTEEEPKDNLILRPETSLPSGQEMRQVPQGKKKRTLK